MTMRTGRTMLLGLSGAALLCCHGAQARAAADAAVATAPAAAALVHDFNARLLAGPTATGVMEGWCRDHHLAADPRVRALPDRAAHREADGAQRALLGVGPDERVAYRRVALMCGERLFSVAQNWYVPGRLTPEINALLDTGDTPFGTAVRPLGPSRRSLGVTWLWDGTGPAPDALMVHRALVVDAQGRPLSLVVETYQRGLIP